MNRRSIGIEHVAKAGEEITPAQARTSFQLISWLMQEYNVPKRHVLPHCCVVSTDCCGDLFKAFGGGRSKSCQEQTAALHGWMASMEGQPGEAAPETAAYSRGHALADEAESFENGRGDVRTEMARSLAGATASALVEADQNDVGEFSNVPIVDAPDFATVEGDLAAARSVVETIFPQAETAGFDFAAFESFMQTLGLRHFTPVEFLFLGSSNESGRCAGRNTLPPRALWPRIANTARMLDEIRHRLGAPIKILSCYRSQAYNDCISGAGGSLHKHFNAIDWRCSTGTSAQWRSVAQQVRSSKPQFLGGVGYYPGSNFIHIDTRGSRADWSGR
jgi:N-acetylmuramoyl-L-alanine amidase